MKEIHRKNNSLGGDYNKFTLRFVDKELQEKFHEANIEAFLRNGRVALIVSVFIYVLFGFTDYFVINDIFSEALLLRLSIGLLLGIGSFIFSFFKFFDKFGEKIIGFTVLVSGLSILYMIIVSNSDLKMYYYFGFYIVVLVSNVFFRQSFINCLLGSILFSIAFEYTTFITLGFNSLYMLNHWYFYSALIMLLVNSYSSELHRINEFLLRRQVEKQNHILISTNEELDHLVAEKTEELQNAYQKEKKANLLQQTFLKNISHQIRTPLNCIIGLSESCLASNNLECSDMDIKQINESGKDLLRMIDDITLYSKIEAESLTINKSTFNIDSILEKIKKYFQEINKRQIKLNIYAPKDNSYYIYSDFDKLMIILKSLLSDAYNRTNEGEVNLTVSVINKSNIVFKIYDTGKNLDKSYIQKILSVKWLEENKNIHSDEFGLSLINKLCSYFGKGLNISNNEMQGNIISFDVNTPVKIKDLKEDVETKVVTKSIEGIKVLVVEDVTINYSIIKRILEKVGVIVERAVDGLEAVAKASEREYDAILMDIQMPNMNGIDATKEIRSKGINVPIIAQTANILAEDKHICIEAGCNDYIGKPINAIELIGVVTENVNAN